MADNEVYSKSEAEIIGENVIANREKRRQYNETMHEQWLVEGQHFKDVREAADISQRELSESMGIDTRVVYRFEQGLPIKRRPAIRASYGLAVENIMYRRSEQVRSLKNVMTVVKKGS